MPSVFLLRRCRPAMQKSQQAVARMAGWWVCGQSESVREAGRAIEALKPDIVACDLRLLDGHASRLAFQMQPWARRPQLMLLSACADDLRLFDALRAGASSYAVDLGDGQGLAAGLRQLVDGRAPMTPQIAQQFLAEFGLGRSTLAVAQSPAAPQDLAPAGRGDLLSRADQHLLSLLAHGLLAQEIGERWLLGQAGVEAMVWQLYARLHALGQAPAQPQDLGGSVSMKLCRAASFS